jgi:hypothetical protein
MARAFTQEVPRHLPPYRAITLVLETPQEAHALLDLLEVSTGQVLYEIYGPYDEECKKQREVIENAVS